MSIPTTFNRMGLALTPTPIDEHDYLSFTATADNSSVALAVRSGTPPAVSLQYSKDKARWKTYTIGNKINLSENEKVYFRGNNASFNSSEGGYNFVTSGAVDVGGNIMSLVDKTCESTTLAPYIFILTFYNCASLNNAENLKLPSNALTSSCYRGMFKGCSGLSAVPILSATSLEVNCYREMFRDCTSLTNAPELPATILANSCYQGMFQGCTSLTKAPELLATELSASCYSNMFYECSGLNEITVGFTDWGNGAYTYNWVVDVASNGVFICPSGLAVERGVSRIPSEWIINELGKDPLCIKTRSAGNTVFLNYQGDLQSVDNGHMEQGEGWEEPQEPIYHPAETHWDDELQEEVVDVEEWWEDMPPIYHDGEETWISDYAAVPPYDLEYSTDGVTWQSAEFNPNNWDSTTGTNAGAGGYYMFNLVNVNDVVYLRGTNSDGFYTDNNTYGRFTSYGEVDVLGNIMSIVDSTLARTDVPSSCFRGLFTGLSIVSAKKLSLPASTLGTGCYYGMFENCVYLTEAPNVLPAQSLGATCYREMFKGCTSLTAPPKIYANTLANACCFGMFQDCTSLVKVPQISVPDTLPEQCFCQMFYGCTALTGTLAITPHTFGNHACRSMYQNCTSITGHGSIGQKDSVMGDGALEYMFYGCTSFNPPHIGHMSTLLPMSGYSQSCFEGMFKDCTSLRETARLNGASVDSYSFAAMYSGCSSLIDASDCFHTGQKTPAQGCYNAMFKDCVNLTHSPHIYLSSLTNIACYEMFKGCSKLNRVYADFTEWDDEHQATNNWLSGVAESGAFYGSSLLSITTRDASHVPSGWDIPNHDYMYFEHNGRGDDVVVSLTKYGSPTASPTNLQWSRDKATWTDLVVDDEIYLQHGKVYLRSKGPNTYFTDNNNYYRFSVVGANGSMAKLGGNIMSLVDTYTLATSLTTSLNRLFYQNTDISDASALRLPATTLSVDSCYSNMFAGCTGLTKAPALPATTLRYNCYGGMFNNCTSLTDMPELPATQLANYCYNWMFNNCSSLTGAVDLPASTAAQYCYQRMFQGCSNLVNPPTMHLTTVAQGCCDIMFYNCTKLESAPYLPAATLAQGCYGGMFNNCTSLTSISAEFTSWTDINGTGNWVYNVNSVGNFYCPSALTEEHGNNRIPANFTVIAH